MGGLMASLVLRAKIWHIRFRDKRGKSRSSSTKLHTSPKNDVLAQKKLASFEVDLLRGNLPAQTAKIGALLDDVITDYRVNGKKSLITLLAHIETHLRPWFGEMRADRFGADDWRTYQAERQKTARNATVNRERAALLRAFNLARESGRLDTIPHIPRLKENSRPPLFISRPEMESLCRHLPEHLRPLVRVAFLTGWRLGELRQLQWRHVSFDNGEIRLDRGSTKNGESRVFPMTAELRSILEAIAPARPAIHPKAVNIKAVDGEAVTTTTPFVFHYHGEPIGWIYQSWDKAAAAIGKPGLQFRHLRNSAIVEMDRMGLPVKTIMRLVGHRTIDMFVRYRQLDSRDMDRAKELLEACATRAQGTGQGGE